MAPGDILTRADRVDARCRDSLDRVLVAHPFALSPRPPDRRHYSYSSRQRLTFGGLQTDCANCLCELEAAMICF